MARQRQVVRLGIPALIVAGLAIAALWRLGEPGADQAVATTAGSPAAPPLTQMAELLVENSVGRKASLDGVPIRQRTSARTFWIGSDDDSLTFVVLDPDVKQGADVRIEPGARVTLIGLVRPAPAAAQAMQQWSVDEATARALVARGTYLHATEVLRSPAPR